ncbi:MAG: DUF418 domain-containing protein [Sphingomicrobium sp.]
MTDAPSALPKRDRILSLDVIRGIAVMGIFSVNVIDFALIQQAYLNPSAGGGAHGADLALWLTNHIFIDEKMRTLFSILFGASTLLVIDRATAKGENAARVHFGRMGALLLLGLIHFYLIWVGDILVSYAIAGMVAYRTVRLRPKTQLTWAAVLLTIGAAQFTAGSWQFYSMEQKVATHTATAKEIKRWDAMRLFSVPDPVKAKDDTETLRSQWPERTVRRFDKEKFQPFGGALAFLPETLGLMLLGMAGYRSGFLTGEWPRRTYARIAAAGIAIGVPFSLVSGLGLIFMGFPPWLLLGANYGFGLPAHVAMALGYAALIILAMRSGGWLTTRIAATGRMAFTNYLGTSIIASLIFYGDGLALFGHLSRFEAWAAAVPGMWLLMLAWSKPWLDRFRYGPFEWVWRSLARWEFQSMRRRGKRAEAVAA